MDTIIIDCQTKTTLTRPTTQAELDAEAAIQAARDAAALQIAYDEAVLQRKVRYQSEADPLFMEYMYENEKGNPIASAKRTDWVSKVDEIKAAIPLPQV